MSRLKFSALYGINIISQASFCAAKPPIGTENLKWTFIGCRQLLRHARLEAK